MRVYLSPKNLLYQLYGVLEICPLLQFLEPASNDSDLARIESMETASLFLNKHRSL